MSTSPIRRYKRQQEREADKLRKKIHEEEMKKMKENPVEYMKQVEQYLKNLKDHYDKQQSEQIDI
jgi:hypothetical protein